MDEFDLLLGEWEVAVPQFGGAGGRAVFERLEDGGFVVQRSSAPDPAPDSVWIIGADDSAEPRTVLYHDARGVSRVYQTSLVDGVWRVWRDAPGFAQRYTGRLSADGRTITGAWELSRDDATWEHDFDLIYTKTG
ncbi:MAG TPA: hypothetical protein VOB72_16090 [Candidatus Dormibacteraeota bacterium]|nr:hypothetical protein [Candidatus Dormibacteraeota bacterium]